MKESKKTVRKLALTTIGMFAFAIKDYNGSATNRHVRIRK